MIYISDHHLLYIRLACSRWLKDILVLYFIYNCYYIKSRELLSAWKSITEVFHVNFCITNIPHTRRYQHLLLFIPFVQLSLAKHYSLSAAELIAQTKGSNALTALYSPFVNHGHQKSLVCFNGNAYHQCQAITVETSYITALNLLQSGKGKVR